MHLLFTEQLICTVMDLEIGVACGGKCLEPDICIHLETLGFWCFRALGFEGLRV